MTSPLGKKGLADRLVARSESAEPQGAQIWTLLVTDQLVEAAREWSGPVQFRFEKDTDGRVEMWLRTV